MRFGAVLWTSLKVLFWFTMRSLFIFFRQIAWLLTGVQYTLWTNQKPSSYQGTAHVRTIKRRFKMDLMIQPANLNNFIAVHHSFCDPEYVLRNNVTLYSLTEDMAVFVESEPDVDASSSKYSSFFRIAQFQLAKRVIVLPIHVFHKLAEQIGDPKGSLIFLTNTSRCGSTLLTQVFEETGRSVAISEPDAMYSISAVREKMPNNPHIINHLMTSTVRMLCKPMGADKNVFVIKLSQQTTSLTPDLIKLFPQARHLFMYRNGLKVAQSVAKLMRSLPFLEFIMVFAKRAACMNVARKMTSKFGLPIGDFDNIQNLICPIYCGGIMWASSIHRYMQFKSASLPVVAVRYEDMVQDCHYALKQIFDYCNLEYQKEATERAFSRDSQENSPISRDLLKQFKKTNVISEDTTEHLDDLCAIFKVPRLYEWYIAEDTITYRPKEQIQQSKQAFESIDLNVHRVLPKVQNEAANVTSSRRSSVHSSHSRQGSITSNSSGYSTDIIPEQIVIKV